MTATDPRPSWRRALRVNFRPPRRGTPFVPEPAALGTQRCHSALPRERIPQDIHTNTRRLVA